MSYFPFFRKESFRDERLNAYQRLDFRTSRSALVKNHTFVVFDCESTGLQKSSALVSIGAVRVYQQNISVKDAFNVRLSITENNEQAQIHGEIGNDSAMEPNEGLIQFLDYIGHATLVGLSVQMDIQWIKKSLHHLGISIRLKNEIIDVLNLLQRIEPDRFKEKVGGMNNLDLDTLCDDFGIEIENRHAALGDAYMTAQLFMKLVARLEQRGIVTMGDLLKKPSVL